MSTVSFLSTDTATLKLEEKEDSFHYNTVLLRLEENEWKHLKLRLSLIRIFASFLLVTLPSASAALQQDNFSFRPRLARIIRTAPILAQVFMKKYSPRKKWASSVAPSPVHRRARNPRHGRRIRSTEKRRFERWLVGLGRTARRGSQKIRLFIYKMWRDPFLL